MFLLGEAGESWGGERLDAGLARGHAGAHVGWRLAVAQMSMRRGQATSQAWRVSTWLAVYESTGTLATFTLGKPRAD